MSRRMWPPSAGVFLNEKKARRRNLAISKSVSIYNEVKEFGRPAS